MTWSEIRDFVYQAVAWAVAYTKVAKSSDVLLGVGIAAVVTGVALFFVEGRHPIERRAWRLTPAPGGIAFSWGGP